MRKIGRFCLFLWVILAPQLLAGTVYYVDSMNGNDGNAGTSSAQAWRTVAKINSRSFSPGDQILFVRGGVWRQQLIVPSSGSSTNPITFGAYGSGADPVITGADLVTNWTLYSTNVWSASLATQAKVVLFDGAKGNRKSAISGISANHDWFWGSNTLYVYSADNPSLVYYSPGIEAGKRDGAITVNKAYIAFKNLHIYGSNTTFGGAIEGQGTAGCNAISVDSCTVEKNNYGGIWFQNCGNHSVVNCVCRYNHHGMFFYKTAGGYTVSNNVVDGGTYANSSNMGICCYGETDALKIENFGTISNVTAFRNGDGLYFIRADDVHVSNCTLHENDSPAGEGYGVGIENSDDVIVEHCDIYNNESRGIGICADEALFPANNEIVRYNRIHGNGTNPAHDMIGIQINLYQGAVCTGTQVYYNLIYDHIRTSPDRGRGLYIEGAGILAYNNVFYNNHDGIYLMVSQADNCVIKNNVFLNNITYHIGVVPGVTGSDINFNTYYPDTGSKFLWSQGNYNFAGWKASTAQDSASKVGDPKFIDISNQNFHLGSDSPCIDAGTNLNLTQDFDGNTVPFGSGVDTGAYEFQSGNDPLAMSLSASPSTGTVPLTVSFRGSATGGSSPYSFSWNFGDGQSSTSQNPEHTYSLAGNYTATLTVTDSQDANASKSAAISVITAPSELVATASASPVSGTAPLAVNFRGSATGGTAPYSYGWTFGDGGSSPAQNPAHTYQAAGSYTATLSVTDSLSANATAVVSISVGSAISTATLSLAAETGAPASGQGGTTDPSPGIHSYRVGSAVQVNSKANTDYRFSKWTGDIVQTWMFNVATTITVDRNKSLSGTFCTKCGDVNGDLKITPADAQLAFDIFLRRIANPTWCELENGDVTCDGTQLAPKVTPADAQFIFHKFLRKQTVSSDCSGNSRAATSLQNLESPSVRLIIDHVTSTQSGDILVPIIVESASAVDAFGFDLVFSADALTYAGLEIAELTAGYNQLDGNVILGAAPDQTAQIPNGRVLRVGGYTTQPAAQASSGVLVTLIFKATGKRKGPGPMSFVAAYDDLQNASLKKGMTHPKNRSQSRRAERPARNIEGKLTGRIRHD